MELATQAVQAHERLHHHLKVKNRQDACKQLLDDSTRVLEHLVSVRSQLEGTSVDFDKTQASEEGLQKLRQLVLMHTSSSITSEVRSQFSTLVDGLLTGGVKKIVFAALVACPWYLSTQWDRGLQAKHNTLLVLYMHTDKMVFSPVNYHVKEQSEVIDQDWFYAAEVYHFAHYLVKGKCRFMETLFLPEDSIVYSSPEWELLKQSFGLQEIAGLRGMLEQCRGQAVGAVGKKSAKTGKMRVREAATLYEFCESFRLLSHAWNILNRKPLQLSVPSEEDLPSYGREALQKLKSIYQEEHEVTKTDLYEVILRWKAEIDGLMKTFKFTKNETVELQVSSWLYRIRTLEKQPTEPIGISNEDSSGLKALLEKVGGVVSGMPLENIVMVARAGSFIYNLATPQSDVDYVVIYKEPIKTVLGSCKRLTECKEHRGPHLSVEYGAYEVKTLCEMLIKGSVVMTELVFVDGVDYASQSWKELAAHKSKFVTEKLIVQYFGLIRNNMMDVESKKHENSPRERKLFYQIFHKLDTLEELADGRVPSIRSTGQKRDFIMKIREGPLQGDISRDNLFRLAADRRDALKGALLQRSNRLPENVNFTFMRNWLMEARGWK